MDMIASITQYQDLRAPPGAHADCLRDEACSLFTPEGGSNNGYGSLADWPASKAPTSKGGLSARPIRMVASNCPFMKPSTAPTVARNTDTHTYTRIYLHWKFL